MIVGFDPMQWPLKSLKTQLATLPAADFDEILLDCYRQSSGLARKATELISAVHERSSFRVDPPRIMAERTVLEELSAQYLKGLSFSRPGGRFAVRECHRWTSWRKPTDFGTAPTYGRTPCPALLVLEDRVAGIKTPTVVKQAKKGIKTQTEGLDTVGSYRGLDYQAVWIFLDRAFYYRVQQGVTGLRGFEWTRLLQLHVPLTRARDETVLFLVD